MNTPPPDFDLTEPPDDPDAGPQPPQDLAAERSVLGAAMLNNGVMGEILGAGLTGRDFYRPAHEQIWTAICALDATGERFDAVTVADELTKRGDLAKIGGPVYLHTCLAMTPSAPGGAQYATIVVERAILRRLVEAGTRVVQMAYAAASERRPGNLDEVLSLATAELAAVGAERTDAAVNAADAIEDLINRKEAGPLPQRRGWRTGYPDLDEILLPMQAQQFCLFAARPSVGKSVSLRDMARSMAVEQGARVLFHTMEMSTEETTCALAGAEASVLLNHLKDDTYGLTDREAQRLADAYGRFAGATLIIDERESLSLQQLRASIRRHQPDVTFVDYVQLGRSGKRTESRYVEVSEFGRGLKNLAKAEDVLIIGAAQLKRDAANRKPELADLKDSGELEQAADTVVMIHREDMTNRETKRAGQADFIVAKQRAGERKDAVLGAQLYYGRFVPWDDAA